MATKAQLEKKIDLLNAEINVLKAENAQLSGESNESNIVIKLNDEQANIADCHNIEELEQMATQAFLKELFRDLVIEAYHYYRGIEDECDRDYEVVRNMRDWLPEDLTLEVLNDVNKQELINSLSRYSTR